MIRVLRAQSECFLVWCVDIIFSTRGNISVLGMRELVAMMLDLIYEYNFKLLETLLKVFYKIYFYAFIVKSRFRRFITKIIFK